MEAVIEDELACLHQENECLRLMEEHLARQKAMAKRSQIMQQQIEQERATQAAFATTTTTTTTASALESVVAVMETNTGQHRQQVPLG
jgi:TPP-dependent pyruvate/acetoin dehydrogenase alpha subunit